ncbi:MAG: VOC family protein [Planctomycetes bacterium]|nr:VOC family protein [Planctomycetota bacterium]
MGNFLCHWEIPAENPVELRKFYETMFNWKFEPSDITGDDYLMFSEGEKGVGGGIGKSTTPGSVIMNYIMVDDIEAFENKIVELGGEIIKSKTPIPGYGFYCEFKDPQGNILGLFQNASK